jgi:hypothetical protein
MKLSPMLHVKPTPTLWLDPATGAGVEDMITWRRMIRLAAGEPLRLAHVLEFARGSADHSRVMLTGDPIPREWLLATADGWEHGRHWLDHETPTGRYRHSATGATVEVRRAAEWFGEGTYSPADAARAWATLGGVLAAAFRQESPPLLRSPGATGLDLWLRTAGGDVPDPLPDDTQELIRSTSPQHRIELRRPTSKVVPAVWVVDARWSYAALTRGLGSGPAHMLTGSQAEAHYQANPYARARYRVTWTAPHWWAAAWGPTGLLMAKDDDGTWQTPPAGTGWADAAEVHLAVSAGWEVRFHEAIAFSAGRPLDTWTDRLIRARDLALPPDDPLPLASAVMAGRAVRAILLHAIGSWHSTGRDEVTVTASPMTPPAGDGWGPPERLDVGGVLWRRRSPVTSDRAAAMRHPEWSSQVWGRAHLRILDTPGAGGRRQGVLSTPPGDVLGIYGDSLITTRRPQWADYDDGKPGRLRVKGHLCGPVAWEPTAAARDRLTRLAEATGPTCPKGCD